jgi:electron transport complex protein RnfC
MGLFKKHLNGIHVGSFKNTMDCQSEIMPVPDRVYMSMVQHIGAACQPLVSPGDMVKVGQPIGDSDAPVSAPIHSSVSGKVLSIEDIMSSLGTKDQMIVIETDKLQTVWEGIKVPKVETREEFVKAIRASGLVGLGGAAFPTHIKYSPKNFNDVKTLIINGAECEPYITSDYRSMLESTAHIINGCRLVMKYLELTQCYIGIEDNKPKAIEALTQAAANDPAISIITLKSQYPQGAERVLIYETTGKSLPPGKLPAEIGVLVSNISSVAFISRYFKTGMPLIRKRITVDGNAVTTPKNLYAPIGASIYDVIQFCGGYKTVPRKILMGGPMMGRAIYDDKKALIKNNNAILAFDEEQVRELPETACIKCGRCVQACPLNLMPTYIAKAYESEDLDALKKLKVTICMECGCCSYVCPAKKQLAMTNRLAKKLVLEGGIKQ